MDAYSIGSKKFGYCNHRLRTKVEWIKHILLNTGLTDHDRINQINQIEIANKTLTKSITIEEINKLMLLK